MRILYSTKGIEGGAGKSSNDIEKIWSEYMGFRYGERSKGRVRRGDRERRTREAERRRYGE
jgi:hypothetical protein